jgi:hypothetical protein
MDAEAKAGSVKNRFDQADRDRIRRALMRYMQEHAIGVPTLQKEIAAANDLSLDRVPLKTLQRFLGNTHRSNEAMVRFCDRFIAATSDANPIDALGEQIAAFLGVWRDRHGCRPVPPELAGSFRVKTKVTAAMGVRLWNPARQQSEKVPYSELEIALLPGRAFALVRETVANWTRQEIEPPSPDAETVPRRSYEGVVIHPNGAFFALLRNVLTGAPRTYWITRYTGNQLLGHGHEALSSLDAAPKLGSEPVETAEVIIEPAADNET